MGSLRPPGNTDISKMSLRECGVDHRHREQHASYGMNVSSGEEGENRNFGSMGKTSSEVALLGLRTCWAAFDAIFQVFITDSVCLLSLLPFLLFRLTVRLGLQIACIFPR